MIVNEISLGIENRMTKNILWLINYRKRKGKEIKDSRLRQLLFE